jgi:hypothetical protein
MKQSKKFNSINYKKNVLIKSFYLIIKGSYMINSKSRKIKRKKKSIGTLGNNKSLFVSSIPTGYMPLRPSNKFESTS